MVCCKSPVRVLKSSAVSVSGTVRIGPHIAVGGARGLPAGKTPPTAAPQARLVEKTDTYAVIEVTCGCGQKVSVLCEYADAAADA